MSATSSLRTKPSTCSRLGLPLLIGAYFDHMDYGLVSSPDGLVFWYPPNTPLSHRMVTQMACAFAMTACYTLGQASPAPLIQARFFDTVLGCLVRLAGGICLHSPRFRAVVGGQMRRLAPSCLVWPPATPGPGA